MISSIKCFVNIILICQKIAETFKAPTVLWEDGWKARIQGNFLSLGSETVLEDGWATSWPTAWRCGKELWILPHYYFPWLELWYIWWFFLSQLDRLYSEKKLLPSWCHWRTDDGSERSRKKKNTAPRWFEKQEKILGAKGGSWRSKKMETTVYQSNISIFHKSLDLLISSILNK